MPTQWPNGYDTFTETTTPETTPLSSAGTGNFNHYEHHVNLGDAVEAMQRSVALRGHDHSGGTGIDGSSKLKQVNTHEEPDTDKALDSLHHSLGPGKFQAAPGNHKHVQDDIEGLSSYICTSETRPTNPALGTRIFETDTNAERVWTRWRGESAARWVLLPGADVPICRLLAGAAQRIVNTGSILEWRVEEEDNWSMFDVASPTEVVIREAGLYSIDASVAWSPDQIFGDNAFTRIMLNGQPTTRVHGEFVRGDIFTPGFVQSVDLTAKVRFAKNDRLSIQARHNGLLSSWTFSSTSTKQDSRLDIAFLSS